MPFDGNPELSRDQLMLSKAQDILRRDGWITGTILAPDGRKCVMGALIAAMEVEPNGWFSDRRPQLDEAICEEVIARIPISESSRHGLARYRAWGMAATWNNDHAKDAADVINFLECVKARLDGV